MDSKDYYGILQVHPKAEKIIIEAAYKRLAREYHPDVSKATGAHQRMIDINEAYKVLSSPSLRKEYDLSRKYSKPETTQPTPKASSTAHVSQPSTAASQAQQQSTFDHHYIGAPKAPNPQDFGIDADYFDRAVRGAIEWEKRKKVVSNDIADFFRTLFYSIAFGMFCLGRVEIVRDWIEIPSLICIAIPVFLEILISLINSNNDIRLLKEVFNPKYNPNYEDYNRFAIEKSKYDIEIMPVYIPKNGYRFHRNAFCGNMNTPIKVEKYMATQKGYTPCSRCGYLAPRPRLLPPPFGHGSKPLPMQDESNSSNRANPEASPLNTQNRSTSPPPNSHHGQARHNPSRETWKSGPYPSGGKPNFGNRASSGASPLNTQIRSDQIKTQQPSSSSRAQLPRNPSYGKIMTRKGEEIQCTTVEIITNGNIGTVIPGIFINLIHNDVEIGACVISKEECKMLSGWILEKSKKSDNEIMINNYELNLVGMALKIQFDYHQRIKVGIIRIHNSKSIIEISELIKLANELPR